MSQVQRFWCHEAQNIRCVREEDYDAAQSQLAALREELVIWKVASRTNKASADEYEQRLADAERRNAVCADLLSEVLNEVPHGWGESFSDSELAERIRAALNPKPEAASHDE